jgi:hypothetical protein
MKSRISWNQLEHRLDVSNNDDIGGLKFRLLCVCVKSPSSGYILFVSKNLDPRKSWKILKVLYFDFLLRFLFTLATRQLNSFPASLLSYSAIQAQYYESAGEHFPECWANWGTLSSEQNNIITKKLENDFKLVIVICELKTVDLWMLIWHQTWCTMPMDEWKKMLSNRNRKDLAKIQINRRNKTCEFKKRVDIRIGR